MAEPPEPGRVVEVWAQDDHTGISGSGYLVRDDLVLTAGHVTDAGTVGIQARRLGAEDWAEGKIVWRGQVDAALIRLAEAGSPTEPEPTFGRVAGIAPVSCRALGFPDAQVSERVRDTEHLVGEIDRGGGLKYGLLTVHVGHSVPLSEGERSPWQGMSGAALFSGELLVGVLIIDPPRFGPDRLLAAPIDVLAKEPGFRAALAADALELPAVEDVVAARGVLTPPYQMWPGSGSATSLLLRSEFGVAPFRGRTAELEALSGWCDVDERVAVGVLTGGGGIGKTRLAAELCARQGRVGWLTGSLVAPSPGLASAASPVLVTIDEAHTRVDEVASLLATLRGFPQPARILLLSRGLGEWWSEVLPDRLAGDASAQVALASALTMQVGPAHDDVAGRREAFEEAARAFAATLGHPVPALAAPDLTGDPFDRMLFIHLAALTALEGGEEAPREGPIADALIADALDRERKYWRETASAAGLGLDTHVLRRAVAVCVVARVDDEGSAAEVLRAVPDLVDAREQSRREVARWLRGLYPQPLAERERGSWWRPLAPDLLGEALLGQVLGDVRELAAGVLDRVTAPARHRAMAVLTQAARRHRAAEDALADALLLHVGGWWTTAMAVAREMSEPIGRLLADALDHEADAALAEEIKAALPRHSVALRGVRYVVAKKVLEKLMADEQTLLRDIELSQLLVDLADSAAQLARPQEALGYARRSVEILDGAPAGAEQVLRQSRYFAPNARSRGTTSPRA
jgi:hypothetical protein